VADDCDGGEWKSEKSSSLPKNDAGRRVGVVSDCVGGGIGGGIEFVVTGDRLPDGRGLMMGV
jgi:hypothetical protein